MIGLVACPDILDFEASGFGVDSYPIEVGFCLANEERFCALIKPAKEWAHWDKSAEEVHGISLALLNKIGLPIGHVCELLNKKLANRTLYSDAWVADKAWMNRLYEACGLRPSFQLSAIENIQTECQYFVWDRVRHRLLNELPLQRHRASSDAHFIQKVFLRSRQECDQPRL